MNDQPNPWISIVAQGGLELAIALAKLLEEKTDPTSADFIALKAKHGTKTADEFLSDAQKLAAAIAVAKAPANPT